MTSPRTASLRPARLPSRLPILAIALACALVLPLTAQTPGGWQPTNPFAEVEAPAALLDLDVGDDQVELFLLGSWTIASRLGTGLALHPPRSGDGSRLTAPWTYPELDTTLLTQTVDLTVSVWLRQRFFFEASVADASTLNSLAAGYWAPEGLLRELVVGSVPLAVERYPFQVTGNSDARTGSVPLPGAVARLATERTRHELLLQVESSRRRELTLVGTSVVEEVRIPLERWEAARAWVLPDAPVSDLVVLAEVASGDRSAVAQDNAGRRYEILDAAAGDYVADLQAGTLRLDTSIPSDRAIVVTYLDASGRRPGAAGTGQGALVPLDVAAGGYAPTTGALVDFAFAATSGGGWDAAIADGVVDLGAHRVTLTDGRAALLLHEPGRWSPFERAGLYRVPGGGLVDGAARPRIVRRGDSEAIESSLAIALIDGGRIISLVDATADTGPRSIGSRYPLATRSPRTTNAQLYGPLARRTPELRSDLEILLLSRSERSETVILDGEVIPGSVTVLAGSSPLADAEIDAAAGTVTLPPDLGDLPVSISWRVTVPGGGSTEIVAVSGNRFDLADRLTASLAAGTRWAVTDAGYSSEIDEYPGRVTLSGDLTFEGERLSASVAGALQLASSDTTGLMRLTSGGASEVVFTPRADTVYAAATPTDRSLTASGAALTSLAPEARALARYRDLWSVNLLGDLSLARYDTPGAPAEDGAGLPVGPYLAASFDPGYSGTVAVLEWDALPAAGGWLGLHLRPPSGPLDLTTATRLVIPVRYLDDADTSTGAPELIIQIGPLAEDLDGDGQLDRGESSADPGIPFDSPDGPRTTGANAPGLTAPHTEDGSGNGILDREVGEAIATHVVATSTLRSGDGWQTVTIELTPGQAARLREVRGVRVILANADGAASVGTGRLLVGAARVRRTTGAVVTNDGTPDGTGRAAVAVIDDPATAGARLADRYPVVARRLESDDEAGRVTRLGWSGAVDGTPVAAELPIAPWYPDRHDRLTLYAWLATPAGSGLGTTSPTVSVVFAPSRFSAASETIRAEIPASLLTGGWREVTLDLAAGTVAVDGTPVADALVSNARAPDELISIARIEVTGIQGGTLYVDELTAVGAPTTLAGLGTAEVRWRDEIRSGPLAGLRWQARQSLAARTTGARESETRDELMRAISASQSLGWAAVSRSEVDLAWRGIDLRGELLARGREEGTPTTLIAHELTLPLLELGGRTLVLRERYIRDTQSAPGSRDRTLSLSVTGTGGAIELGSALRADGDGTTRRSTTTLATAIGEVTLAAVAEHSLTEPDRAVPDSGWAGDWITTTASLIPLATGERRERTTTAALDLGIAPLELYLDADAATSNDVALGGAQTDSINLGLAWSIAVRPIVGRPWRLSPSLRRSWSLDHDGRDGSLGEDIASWGGSVGVDHAIASAPPLWDIFAGEPVWGALPAGARRRATSGELALAWVRTPGSRLTDLVIPARLSAGVGRKSVWEASSRSDIRTWTLGLTTAAINLFGVTSARGGAAWLESDQYELTLDGTIGEAPTGTLDAWELTTGAAASLFLLGGDLLSGELALTIGGGETAGGGASAEVTREARRAWPAAPEAVRALTDSPQWRQRQRLALDLGWDREAALTSEVRVDHTSALALGSGGEVAISVETGWLTRPLADGTFHGLGVRITLEGRLSW